MSQEKMLTCGHFIQKQIKACGHITSSLWCIACYFKKMMITVAWKIVCSNYDEGGIGVKSLARGCCIPSMCSFCSKNVETSFHLLFECLYAFNIRCWFATIMNCTLHFQSKEDIWPLCDKSWNQQCKVVVKASLINIMNVILYARNQLKFNDKIIHWRSSISSIIANVSKSDNISNVVSSTSMLDFAILKKFDVSIHSPKALVIKKVLWQLPFHPLIKRNIDGSSNVQYSACGGILIGVAKWGQPASWF